MCLRRSSGTGPELGEVQESRQQGHCLEASYSTAATAHWPPGHTVLCPTKNSLSRAASLTQRTEPLMHPFHSATEWSAGRRCSSQSETLAGFLFLQLHSDHAYPSFFLIIIIIIIIFVIIFFYQWSMSLLHEILYLRAFPSAPLSLSIPPLCFVSSLCQRKWAVFCCTDYWIIFWVVIEC